MTPSRFHVAPTSPMPASLPVLDLPVDAGRPPPPLRAAPARPKPVIEDAADSGSLAAMPASALIADGVPRPVDRPGPEAD
jgi:hypothetical protein